MKSKKQIQLEWAIVCLCYIVASLLAVIIMDDWRMGVITALMCASYLRGWYKCWKFHKIGWKEDKPAKPNSNYDLIVGQPRSGTSVSVELITGLEDNEKEE